MYLNDQRAARALARRFEALFRPLGLTNGQFSLMMALNTAEPPSIGRLADFLAMDRTSLTAMLKPLLRRGLATITPGATNRRARHVAIPPKGVALLAAALPLWRKAHAALDHALTESVAERLRGDLGLLVIRAEPRQPAERRGGS